MAVRAGVILAIAALLIHFCAANASAQGIPISISSQVPNELNPDNGGAPNATPAQAAAFAWQEFIALNWPAGPQNGQPGQRETPSSGTFGDPSYQGPLVWHTFRGKVEIFPGQNNPPGYPGLGPTDTSYGYDALPQYNYLIGGATACDSAQQNDPVPWINLDETDQITIDSMYAGIVSKTPPNNSSPQIIRFLAKANRHEYVYVAKNGWVSSVSGANGVPPGIITATQNYLAKYQASPTPDNANYVSLPNNTIEIKAAWRVLNDDEIKSGRFYITTVRHYEPNGMCFVDATNTFGLVALHIIQKTPSAPYFIYATFEQADNILNADKVAVEDADGKIVNPAQTATTPQVCLNDPVPPAGNAPGVSALSNVTFTSNTATCAPPASPAYCAAPGPQLYYQNTAGLTGLPTAGFICVNQRDQAIPQEVIAANQAAHAAMTAYFQQNNIPLSPPPPWLSYKLVNVQYFPHDKVPNPSIPNGSPYSANPPFTAQNPAPSSFYQANIVVETNRSLQMFSGGLNLDTGANTDWNANGTPHTNTLYAGHAYNMGGCMGCHGSQGQSQGGDFSVILARGSVAFPEAPAASTPRGVAPTLRNRRLK
jgi:hypothetical protein